MEQRRLKEQLLMNILKGGWYKFKVQNSKFKIKHRREKNEKDKEGVLDIGNMFSSASDKHSGCTG
jgi:hypothetical protein